MSNSSTSPELGSRPATRRLASVTDHNIALVGPPMVGKSAVALEAMAAAVDRDVLLVTAARSADRLDDALFDDVSVIDCTPGPAPDDVVDVGSPGDLTGISMPVSRFLEGADRPMVVVDSLSSLLMYGETQNVFRFLSVLTTQVAARDGLGLFLVDEGSHEEQTVRTFAQLFDGQVRLREAPGGVEARGKGLDLLSTEWVPARDGR